ncbi:tumor protein p53-inducible protein 11 [Triplophysa rosa]|uniref:Tumor protein p53-inducible protein 11 n=1 Tax=Triplophysa rosa TaxID=992332 RepID=A0A9W7X5P3_TRIRA|nr:tumor protein p53-inducible protein 11 [Triplophysa rosa]
MASTPPPLMKKHSQTDLVSRLKSRKVLGVGGEDDDGEVHRSKVTALTHIAAVNVITFWLLISAVLFTSTSLMALAFPNQLYEIIFELTTTRISIRLYGGALLCISLILWNGLYTAEKVIIQWTLLTEACYFGVQFLVTSITLLEMGTLSNSAIVLLFGEIFFLLVTLSYYHHLGRRTKKI